jgi:cytochrome P450
MRPPIERLATALDPLGTLERARRRQGEPFAVQLQPAGLVMAMSEPDMVETLLTGSSPLVHGHANAATIPLLGRQSVFVAEGETHQQRRRLIGDAFAQGTEAVAERGAALLEGDVAQWPASRPFPLVLRLRSLLLRAHLPLIVDVGDEHRRRALERRVVAMLSPLAALGVLAPRPLERSRWPPAQLFAARRGLVRALVVEEVRERRRRRGLPPGFRSGWARAAASATTWPLR